MLGRTFLFALVTVLAGCASKPPVPVADSQAPLRVESGPGRLAVPAGPVHVVKKGDTVFGIARQYKLSPADLAAWNNLDGERRIAVGQTLRLAPPSQPATEATPAAASGAEVQPIALGGGVEARPLDRAPAPGAVPPAPTFPAGNSATLKRAPKGGKLPYSEENLARLKGETVAAAPAAVPPATPPVQQKPATTPVPPVAPATPTAPVAAVASAIEWGWPAAGKLLANFSDGSAGTAQGFNRGIDIAGQLGEPVLAAAPGKVIFVGVYPKHGNLVVLLHGEGYSTVYAHNRRVLIKEGQSVKRGQRIAELGDSDAAQPMLHFELRHLGKPIDPLKLLPSRG